MKLNRRVDYLSALFVNAAIEILARYGEIVAVRLLVSRELEKMVIVRVLTEPGARRNTSYRKL